MDAIVNILKDPAVWYVLVGYWVFSAIVGALPTPKEASSLWYQFVFRFLHALGGNLNRAAVSLKLPGAAENSADSK